MITEDQIELVASFLRKWGTEAHSFSIELVRGRDEVEPIDGMRSFRANDTASVVIHINGGAQINELPGCPHPRDKQLNETTMGGPPLYRCLLCGETSAVPLSQSED